MLGLQTQVCVLCVGVRNACLIVKLYSFSGLILMRYDLIDGVNLPLKTGVKLLFAFAFSFSEAGKLGVKRGVEGLV